MRAELDPLVEQVWDYCETTGCAGTNSNPQSKVLRLSDHHPKPISPGADFGPLDTASISAELLAGQFPMQQGVRLIGVSLSSLCADPTKLDTQMTLVL